MHPATTHVYVPRNLALPTICGHVGGALVFGVPAAALGPQFALWMAFAGAAFGGATGAFVGFALLRVGIADVAADALRQPALPWWAIAAGTVVSVMVTAITFVVNFQTSGFLDGSPCFSQRIETLIPLQYTCLDAGGAEPLVLPATVVLTVLSLVGAVLVVSGMIPLVRRVGLDGGRVALLAAPVAAFLGVDAVLGAVVVLTQSLRE